MSLPTILVVDDISSFRVIVRDMLDELGFTSVKEAADGEEALTVMKNDAVSLVISDYMMSPKTGIDLLKGMKDEPSLASIPFVLVSAVSEKEVVAHAMELGATTCLTKPLRFATLKKEVLAIFAAQMT